MPLDATRKFHGPDDRLALVAAICRKDPTVQETDWVEWKSMADLTDPRWQSEIGSQIVGFANRMPPVAATNCEGFAYLVLGVEPGQANGVTPIDPSLLQQGVATYAGRDGPRWDPVYVTFQNVSILVIEVAAPQWGDPLYSVRKQWSPPRRASAQGDSSFQIYELPYVRRHGLTIVASAAEIDALVARAKRSPRPTFDLMWYDAPQAIQGIDISEEELRRWSEASTEELLEPIRRAPPPQVRAMFADVMRSALSEDRTPEAYREAVKHYVNDAQDALFVRAIAHAIQKRLGKLSFDLVNLGTENYTAVEVELFIPGPIVAAFDDDELNSVAFPDAPREWGTSRLGELGLIPRTAFPPSPRLPVHHGGVRVGEEGATITFAPEDLRPSRRAQLRPVFVLAHAPFDAYEVRARWSATSTSASGEATGSIAIPVSESVVTVRDLVSARGGVVKPAAQ